jgi:hypothetical protein
MKPILPNTAQSGAVGASANKRPESVFRGIPAGSSLLTQSGELPIDYVCEGDKAITRDFGLSTITGIAHFTATGQAVHLRGGILGHSRPEKDLLLPADQLVLLRDWRAKTLFGQTEVMVPVRRLVDGEFITLRNNVELSLFRVELAVGHIVYADGLEMILKDPV